MKFLKSHWKTLLIVLLALLLCASVLRLTLFSGGGEESLSLWYVSGTVPEARLGELCAEYEKKNMTAVFTKSFDSEKSLAAALETECPDVLICSHLRAENLYNSAMLADAGIARQEYPAAAECAGRGFYPIGTSVPVLAFRTDSAPATGSLEDFFAFCADWYGIKKAACFTADSFSDLLLSASGSAGFEMTGTAEDEKDSRYLDARNALMLSACLRGTVSAESRAVLCLKDGILPCVCAESCELSGLGGDYSFAPIPAMRGGKASYPARLIGLAAMSARAGGFIAWLTEPGRVDSLALAGGLVPLNDTEAESGGLSALLASLCGSDALNYIASGSEYAFNQPVSEAQLREAIDLFR